MEIEIGAKLIKETTVTERNTACAVGSGEIDVFATPMMVALIEEASATCCQQFLEDGMSSVGTLVNVTHLAATPVGMKVRAEAEIAEVDGREITFIVKAYDEAGLIGEGTHKRFIVKKEKFRQKAYAKLG
ncbi:thioesterase family protein [Zongyangia hominis]|uniref:Thioesterase family protein n=1 Tax=Zongyangia hominis TaxID=2763677 RepID=A0A926E8B4_9FIRM|nr:thioesterase family protein [Zongyangia hominis]MBC8569735.1 thioesterase family protein [Zongyangia hominis]